MNNIYRIKVDNNDYSEIQLISDKETLIFNKNFDISIFKGYFNDDTVEYKDNKIISLLERTLPKNIVGIIEIYGKYAFPPNKKGIPAYIFTPLDKHLPKFIVNTKIKKNKSCNQLVSIKYLSWEGKIPKGELVSIFGDYNNIASIEKSLLNHYQIYPHKNNKISEISFNKNNRIEIVDKIFSIDPAGCTDIDDAFSIINKGESTIFKIHISDVYSVLHENKLIPEINNFTSIYLKEQILHMISCQLSTNYCSLIQNSERLMITLEISFKKDNYSYKFIESYGKITKNYSYETYPKMIEKYYQKLETLYYKITNNKIIVNNSHNFIECMMLIYNKLFAEYLLQNNKTLIYRCQSKFNFNTNISDELSDFLKIINSSSAQYSIENKYHHSLNINNYTHATSPIRRIVDLINQGIFHNNDYLYHKFQIDKINMYNKELKKFYRKINTVHLSYILYSENIQEIECYIYDYENNKIFIYVPKYKLNFTHRLIDKKIDKFCSLVEENADIITLNINNNVYTFPKNIKLNLKLFGYPNILNINNSIKVDISDFKMNIIDLPT